MWLALPTYVSSLPRDSIGRLCNWESLCDIRPDCHHHFDASGTSNAMFDELAERSLMSPLAGMKHTYVRLAT